MPGSRPRARRSRRASAGRALDRGGVGQYRHAAVVAPAGEDAALASAARAPADRGVASGRSSASAPHRPDGADGVRKRTPRPRAAPGKSRRCASAPARPDHRIQRGLGLPRSGRPRRAAYAHRHPEHAVMRAPQASWYGSRLDARRRSTISSAWAEVRAADRERRRRRRRAEPRPASPRGRGEHPRRSARMRANATSSRRPPSTRPPRTRPRAAMASRKISHHRARLGKPFALWRFLLGDDRQRCAGSRGGSRSASGSTNTVRAMSGQRRTRPAWRRCNGISGRSVKLWREVIAVRPVPPDRRMSALLRCDKRAATRFGRLAAAGQKRAPGRPCCG